MNYQRYIVYSYWFHFHNNLHYRYIALHPRPNYILRFRQYSYNYQSLYFQLKMCCLLDMLNTTMPRFQSHNNLHYIHM